MKKYKVLTHTANYQIVADSYQYTQGWLIFYVVCEADRPSEVARFQSGSLIGVIEIV